MRNIFCFISFFLNWTPKGPWLLQVGLTAEVHVIHPLYTIHTVNFQPLSMRHTVKNFGFFSTYVSLALWEGVCQVCSHSDEKLTIYAPMIYTAQCIMFWMRAYPLQGEVGGGWALEFESFLGSVKWHRANRWEPFGAQKTWNSRAQPFPTSLSNGYARIQNIMHRAV